MEIRRLFDAVKSAVDAHEDINAQKRLAKLRAHRLEGWSEWCSQLADERVEDMVDDERSRRNIQQRRAARSYGAGPREGWMQSEEIRAFHESVYRYNIRGHQLGMILGEEMVGLADGEQAIGEGCMRNAELLRRLRPLVPDGSTVQEACTEAQIEAVMVEVFGNTAEA